MTEYTNASQVAAAFKRIAQSSNAPLIMKESDSFATLDSMPNHNHSWGPKSDTLPEKIPELYSLARHFKTIPRNLPFTTPISAWEKFYVYSENHSALNHLNQPVSRRKVINANPKNENHFLDSIVSSLTDVPDQGERHIFFVSGTTGVGKTTFVKFHCATKCDKYYESGIIPLRVRFRDVEVKLARARKSKPDFDMYKVLDSHLSQCMLRDIVKFYRFAVRKGLPVAKKLSQYFSKFGDQISASQTLSAADHHFLINFIEKWNDTQLLNSPAHLAGPLVSSLVGIDLKFAIYLDGFDALEPELINLFGDDLQSTFLQSLIYYIETIINNGGGHSLLSDNNTSIIISCRPITISQLKSKINLNIDFDAVLENEFYVTCSDISEILDRRIEARCDDGKSWLAIHSEMCRILAEQFILKVKRVFPTLDKENGIVEVLNYNARSKLLLIHHFLQYYLGKVERKCGRDPAFISEFRSALSSVENFKNFLTEMDIADYEVERLLILGGAERFVNAFEYDGNELSENNLHATFDNIFSYLQPRKDIGSSAYTSFLVKFIALRFVEQKEIMGEFALAAELDKIFGSEKWDRLEWKVLIRSGFVLVHFSDQAYFRISPKGQLVVDSLLYHNVYFERAIQKAILPNTVLKNMHISHDSYGRVWGRNSIVNMCATIQHLRRIEHKLQLPENLKISTQILSSASNAVEAIANEGFADDAKIADSPERKKYGAWLYENLEKV